MINRASVILFIFGFFAAVAVKAAHQPSLTGPSGLEFEAATRAIIKNNDWKYLGEFVFRSEQEMPRELKTRSLKSLRLGAYYRVLENLKLGAFFRHSWGMRHDEDWAPIGGGDWKWLDTSSRGESSLIFDVTPRAIVSFVDPNLVAEAKFRYFHNFYNHHKTIKARPGLTYFHFVDGEPFMNFFLRGEFYFPLNYGTRALYETWVYLGALCHLNSKIKLGTYFARRSVTWGSSEGVKLAMNDAGDNQVDYEINGSTWVIGLFLNYHLDLNAE